MGACSSLQTTASERRWLCAADIDRLYTRFRLKRFAPPLFRGLLFFAAAAAGCAALQPSSVRVIATLRAGSEIRDPAALEREIARKTGLRIVYGAPISERAHAFTLFCDGADRRCEDARARLLAAGLFVDVSLDQKQRRQ